MNISQLARSQRMMYQFISRATNGSDLSQLSSLLPSGGKNDSTTALLQSMGFSDAQGQTVREMARYQLRGQERWLVEVLPGVCPMCGVTTEQGQKPFWIPDARIAVQFIF